MVEEDPPRPNRKTGIGILLTATPDCGSVGGEALGCPEM
jgi:hypothetical protein